MTSPTDRDDTDATNGYGSEREGKRLQAAAGAFLCGVLVVAVAAILLFASPDGPGPYVPAAVSALQPPRVTQATTTRTVKKAAKKKAATAPPTTATTAPPTTTTTAPRIVVRTPVTRSPVVRSLETPVPTSPATVAPSPPVQVPYSVPTPAPPDTVAVPVAPTTNPK